MSVLSLRRARAVGLLGAVSTAALVAMASPAAALPAFGTAPVTGGGTGGQGAIQSVTVGQHAGYDRVVFATGNGIPHYRVEYVSQVTQDASGQPVPLQGSAFLQVSMQLVSAAVQPTITPRFPALRQIKGAGFFEAVASYGIGQTSKAGFRVFTLSSPNRVVIDLQAPASTGGTTTGGSTAGTKSGSETGGLANTGFPTFAVIGLAAGLLLAGLAGYGFSRRRSA
jgi:LPXTG-motif cell wall-anchored protein